MKKDISFLLQLLGLVAGAVLVCTALVGVYRYLFTVDSNLGSSTETVGESPEHVEESSTSSTEEDESPQESTAVVPEETVSVVPTETVSTPYIATAFEQLRVREIPDTSGKVLGYLPYGELIDVISIDQGWAEIIFGEKTAFVSAEYILPEYDFNVSFLATVMFAEASICGEAEMARVGQVVVNRANTEYYEFADCHTFVEVIAQPGQYTDTWERIQEGLTPSPEALYVAEGLLDGTIDSGLGEDVLFQTGFKPSWGRIVYVSPWHYYATVD